MACLTPSFAPDRGSADGDMKRRLRDIVAQKSLSIGPEVTLASGAKSRFYFNMKPTMFDPAAANLIADMILDAIAGDPPYALVGGLEMGAVPIAACVALRSAQRGHPIPAFFVRKQAKDHGAKKLIEGEVRPGMNVLVLEDVTTTGGSAMKAVAAIRAAGGQVTKVVTLVDRLEGATLALRSEGISLVALLTAADFNIDA